MTLRNRRCILGDKQSGRFGTVKNGRGFTFSPDYTNLSWEIFTKLGAHGIPVEYSTEVVVDNDFLDTFYQKLKADSKRQLLWAHIRRTMLGKKVIAGAVRGEDASRKLYELCGTQTDPRKCDTGSLRRRYAGGKPPSTLGDGSTYYAVPIHRQDLKQDWHVTRPQFDVLFQDVPIEPTPFLERL